MLKVLNPTVHGALDYALAIAFLILPSLLGFSQTAAALSYIVGVVYLGVSLVTKYPLGALKLLPFPIHGVIETIMAAAWIVFPWLFGFSGDAAARGFFVVAGIGLLVVAALTDYRATGAETARYRGHERRRTVADRRQRYLAVARERRRGPSDRRGYAFAIRMHRG